MYVKSWACGASAGLPKSPCSGSAVSVARCLWSRVCLKVNIAEFQRQEGRTPRGKKTGAKSSAQPRLPSVRGSAGTQVLGGKQPLLHGNGDGPCGQGGAGRHALLAV